MLVTEEFLPPNACLLHRAHLFETVHILCTWLRFTFFVEIVAWCTVVEAKVVLNEVELSIDWIGDEQIGEEESEELSTLLGVRSTFKRELEER